MTEIRLYLDEDASDRALEHALQLQGIDVLVTVDAGRGETGDADQLAFATSHGRMLYSANIGHFFHLHTVYLTQGRSHAGIVLVRQQRFSIGEQARRLVRLIKTKSAEEMVDTVEFLTG